MTLTKEQLIEKLQHRVAVTANYPDVEEAQLHAAIFKIALAALTAEPEEREAFETFMADRFGDTIDRRRAKNGGQGYMAWDMIVAWTVWQRRAAMLQGAAGNFPAIPDGYALVPVELTGAMTNALTEAILDDLHNVDVWRSVLAAAPQHRTMISRS